MEEIIIEDLYKEIKDITFIMNNKEYNIEKHHTFAGYNIINNSNGCTRADSLQIEKCYRKENNFYIVCKISTMNCDLYGILVLNTTNKEMIFNNIDKIDVVWDSIQKQNIIFSTIENGNISIMLNEYKYIFDGKMTQYDKWIDFADIVNRQNGYTIINCEVSVFGNPVLPKIYKTKDFNKLLNNIKEKLKENSEIICRDHYPGKFTENIEKYDGDKDYMEIYIGTYEGGIGTIYIFGLSKDEKNKLATILAHFKENLC